MRTPLYRDFDLAVGPDERVAISAPSGFGKTTLCRMLAGYDRPQKGEILVDGAPLPKRGMCPVQLILQHPETAVDPRMRMSQTLAEAGEVPQRLPGHPETVARAFPARAVGRRAAALLHRPRAGGEPALPCG